MSDNISHHLDSLALMGTLQDEMGAEGGFFHRLTQIAPDDTTRIVVALTIERDGKAPMHMHADIRPGAEITEEMEEDGWKAMPWKDGQGDEEVTDG